MGSICSQPLVVRVDGDSKIGSGHVMRTIALAQAWNDLGGSVHFVSSCLSSALDARIRAEGFSVIRLDSIPGTCEDNYDTIAIAKQSGAQWVVLDGYHFGSDYQVGVMDADLRLLCVDDYGHAGYYCADVVLNQNAHAREETYTDHAPQTKLLLGCSYALLRREFRQWTQWQRETPSVARNVLVTLGGSDPDNVTAKVIDSLNCLALENAEAQVIIGGSNPNYGQLTSAMRQPWIRLVRDARNMPELMAWADIAISAGGSTNWEMAFMGLPVIVIVLAENQQPIAEKMCELGIVHNLGWHNGLLPNRLSSEVQSLLGDTAARQDMSERGRKLVDGQGCQKVVAAMMQIRG